MFKTFQYSRVTISAKFHSYDCDVPHIMRELEAGILTGPLQVESATVTETKVTRFSLKPPAESK